MLAICDVISLNIIVENVPNIETGLINNEYRLNKLIKEQLEL
jgi:hypothetical protein